MEEVTRILKNIFLDRTIVDVYADPDINGIVMTLDDGSVVYFDVNFFGALDDAIIAIDHVVDGKLVTVLDVE